MQRTVLLVFGFLVLSCSSTEENTDAKQPLNNQTDLFEYQVEFEEKALKELIFKRIAITQDDLGRFEMHKAHLNADADEDGYVVINLAAKAKKDMEKSPNPAKFHDAGYLGDYNFLYVWDGKTKKLGTAFKLASSGLVPLKVETANFLDPGFKSLIAEYRIQNSTFQTFFENINGQLIPVFSYTKVNLIGTPNMTVRTHKFVESDEHIQKEIHIYKGILESYNEDEAAKNKNSYKLSDIQMTNEKVYRFFYDPSSRKYATTDELVD